MHSQCLSSFRSACFSCMHPPGHSILCWRYYGNLIFIYHRTFEELIHIKIKATSDSISAFKSYLGNAKRKKNLLKSCTNFPYHHVTIFPLEPQGSHFILSLHFQDISLATLHWQFIISYVWFFHSR